MNQAPTQDGVGPFRATIPRVSIESAATRQRAGGPSPRPLRRWGGALDHRAPPCRRRPPPAPPPDRGPSTGLLVITGSDLYRRRRPRAVRTPPRRSSQPAMRSSSSAMSPRSPRPAAPSRPLARLQLTARRHNRVIRLQRASTELEQLLDFAGLADVVPTRARLRRYAAASVSGSPNSGNSRPTSRKQLIATIRPSATSRSCTPHASNPPSAPLPGTARTPPCRCP